MTDRTWEDNADEFGALTKQGIDLRLAALAACSVEKGAGHGVNKTGPNAPKDGTNIPSFKTSATEFAKRAGTSHPRIIRHLDAWHALTVVDMVRPAADLAPTMVNDPGLYLVDMDVVLIKFAEVFDAGDAGSRPRAPVSEISAAIVTKPGYAEKLVDQMSDEAFEVLSEAIFEAITPTPAVVTETGVKPAHQPSEAKKKTAQKTAEKITDAKHTELIEKLKKQAPPHQKKPDGYQTPAQQLMQKLHAADSLWDTEGVIHYLKVVLEAVLAHDGPLSKANEEFVEERIGVMRDLIKKIETAVEAKKGATVPDTIPDDWN